MNNWASAFTFRKKIMMLNSLMSALWVFWVNQRMSNKAETAKRPEN
jgi:hypothetical protein